MQLFVDREANLAAEEALLNDVKVLQRVILIENRGALDACECLESLANVLQFLLRNEIELKRRDRLQEGALVSQDAALLRFDHFENIVFVDLK